MTTPAFVAKLYGFRQGGIPNTADKGSKTSVAIARGICELLGVPPTQPGPDDAGSALPRELVQYFGQTLPPLLSGRPIRIKEGGTITLFVQYRHLERLQDLITKSGVLASELGTDYEVKPDVTVALDGPEGEFLHATVSCKWTIRSDRVQNARHEAVIIGRHRRGRQPHIVVVTGEPLPSRIASIARGTGEIDTVYHVSLTELRTAVVACGSANQERVLEELVQQDRLRALEALPEALTY